MKISVIVRTYKRPEFLEQALASIQLQTHKDWEVIVFDDGDSSLNQTIVTEFKQRNTNLVTYINSGKAFHLFKESWKIAPKIANGEVMIRLDDDDILDSNCLEFVNTLFTETSDLDFAYGNSAVFKGNTLLNLMDTKTPLDFPKSKDIWSGYVEGHPYNIPWKFTNNYYDEPKHISSIIHASKLNQMCIFHPYIMRTKSILKVVDKINMTSNFVDDLEFLGSLDNLGLGYTSIKKVLSYVRKHDEGSITEEGKETNGVTLWDDIFRVRDEVDFLRPNGTEFQSNVIKIKVPYNYSTQIDSDMKKTFGNLLSNIDNIIKPKSTFKERFDWRRF